MKYLYFRLMDDDAYYSDNRGYVYITDAFIEVKKIIWEFNLDFTIVVSSDNKNYIFKIPEKYHSKLVNAFFDNNSVKIYAPGIYCEHPYNIDINILDSLQEITEKEEITIIASK